MIKLPNIKGLMTIGKAVVVAHRPEILFGTSVVSTVSAVVLAAKGGYKSGRQVSDEEMERVMRTLPAPHVTALEEAINSEENALTVKEKIQLTWMNYLPAAGTTAAALGATTGLHLVHIKEKKAIAAAALMAIDEVKSEAKDFSDRIMEAVSSETDEETQTKIRDKAMDPEAKGVVPISNSDGEIEELYLVRDALSGRDIWSNQHRIEDALIEVNNVLNGSGDCELNHFYNHAGFANIPLGNTMGWSGALVGVEWKETKRDDGRPVREFTFRPAPEKGYDDAHR